MPAKSNSYIFFSSNKSSPYYYDVLSSTVCCYVFDLFLGVLDAECSKLHCLRFVLCEQNENVNVLCFT